MTKKTFLKIHSVDLSQSTKDLVGQIFSSEDPLVPNINQYIRNKEKNELKDDRLSSPLRVEIAIEEDMINPSGRSERALTEKSNIQKIAACGLIEKCHSIKNGLISLYDFLHSSNSFELKVEAVNVRSPNIAV